MNITFCLVEDDAELREGIVAYLEETASFSCLGAFPTAEHALAALPALKPEVILMDINLPGMSGIECVRRLKEKNPTFQVVMLTVYEDSDQVFQALAAGACGYLVKRTPLDKLKEALIEVHQGGSPMSSHIARKVVQFFSPVVQRQPSAEVLSVREQQVLDLLAKGAPYKVIASDMAISMGTLHTYIRRIYDKLHVHSRTEAVVKYLGGAPDRGPGGLAAPPGS